MASKSGQVTLAGRFPKGTDVRLVKVRDETVLRSEGGETVDTQTVDDDGRVQFKKGVDVGARYFIVGYVDGVLLEVRARGNASGDDPATLTQPPIRPARIRLGDGSWADEAPKKEKTPSGEVAPHLGQHQVSDKVPQRSATLRGSAHPVDPDEIAPYPSQNDVPEGTPQRSDTPAGQATPIPHEAPPAQRDVKAGTLQRSDTPDGSATPLPKGDAVRIERDKENAMVKAAIGEPVKAAATPVDTATLRGKAPASKSSPDSAAEIPTETVAAPDGTVPADLSGRDAEGQPLAEDVAAGAGVEPADKPAEARKTPKRATTRRKSQKRR